MCAPFIARASGSIHTPDSSTQTKKDQTFIYAYNHSKDRRRNRNFRDAFPSPTNNPFRQQRTHFGKSFTAPLLFASLSLYRHPHPHPTQPPPRCPSPLPPISARSLLIYAPLLFYALWIDCLIFLLSVCIATGSFLTVQYSSLVQRQLTGRSLRVCLYVCVRARALLFSLPLIISALRVCVCVYVVRTQCA